MVDQAVLVRVLSDYARTLAGDYAIGDVLHDLVEHVTELVGVAGAGVSLAENGQIRFATAINDAIATIERVEEDAQAGPCVDAHRSGDVVLVPDLRDDPHGWPAVAEAALELGVIGVAGIPMRLDGTEVGALSLYATERRDWSADDVSVARLLADMATAYVAHASALQQSRRMSEQLQEALDQPGRDRTGQGHAGSRAEDLRGRRLRGAPRPRPASPRLPTHGGRGRRPSRASPLTLASSRISAVDPTPVANGASAVLVIS